ncbi:hypothetical protein ACFQ1S_02750 [Kibdelosporangium lantanae]|uniref:AbrB/MazE/SpoVT family DNA-binding domain-containing protein n=1 Tax=Kibdelosporangium lantanae TaxID=1497396 RepID=A0ABW3M1M5_9PSEU
MSTALPASASSGEATTGRPGHAPENINDVIAALALPTLGARPSEAARPLPLTNLHQLPRDTAMLYGIGRMDASGRISERHIVQALGWNPGQRLQVALITRGIVFRPATDGAVTVPRSQRLVIPLTARHHCNVYAGDNLLLAAAPDHGIVIVHASTALDDMLVQYHAPSLATDGGQP